MNPLYEKAKDLILIRRTSDNKEFEEYPLVVQPQSVLMTDPANNVICFGACGLHVAFAVSSSYSDTSSFAWYALSASYANSASYCISSSYSQTASYALNSVSGGGEFGNLDGGTPFSVYGGTATIDGGNP